jgi:hypothetical protein
MTDDDIRRAMAAITAVAGAVPRDAGAWQRPVARVPARADLPYLSITEAAPLLRSRRLSPVELERRL